MTFEDIRRQPFITEHYYEEYKRLEIEVGDPISQNMLRDAKQEGRADGVRSILYGIANDVADLLVLDYTAGQPMSPLRARLDAVIQAWEEYAVALQKINGAEQPNYTFRLEYRTHYNRLMSLLGLCILLRREDLLPRLEAISSAYRHQDAVYESLLMPYLPDRNDDVGHYHEYPYEDALDAVYSDDPKEKAELMKLAVDDWYEDNEGEPFYETHKAIGTEGQEGDCGYSGYWCFELAALCHIHQIDDSRFRDCVTYPKDLVDFARHHRL